MKREENRELNFEDFQMQKWNIPKKKAQKEDEKNEVICLIITLTSGVMVIKMSNLAHFLKQIISDSLSKIFSASERSHLALLKTVMNWGSELPLARYQPFRIKDFSIFFLTQHSFEYFYLQYLTSGNFKHIIFRKKLSKIFQVHLNILPNCD